MILQKVKKDITIKVDKAAPFILYKSINLSLSEIKSNQKLQEISLIKQSRLSVMPISKEHWDIILEMGKTSI